MPPIRSGEQSFAPQFDSVGAARRFLAALLEQWDQESLVWPAQQAVSELATNSILHAGTVFTLGAHLLGDGAIRLEVGDGSIRIPRQRRFDVDAGTGRGIALVAGLARKWGVQVIPPGKIVWCELVAEADVGTVPHAFALDLDAAGLDDRLAENDQEGRTNVRDLNRSRTQLLERRGLRAAA